MTATERALARARQTVARTFTDRVTVERPSTGEPVLDRTTGLLVAPPPTVLYAHLPASITHGNGVVARDTNYGDADQAEVGSVVRLPASSVGIRRGDHIVVTGVGPLGNPDLIGSRLEVERADKRTRRASIILPVVEWAGDR